MRRVVPFLLLVLLVCGLPAAAAAKVPKSFIGVQADGPLFNPKVDLASELTTMQRSHVGSVRYSIYWDVAQPYATAADVPAADAAAFTDEGGVPTDWGAVDQIVAETARRGLRLLPVVVRAPQWARQHPGEANSPPSVAGRTAYARFLTALVHRYGPGGAFWTARPDVRRQPIRAWQIWNEPDGVRDWSVQPGIPAYVKLLKPAYRAVKAADPHAQVVLAGLVGRSWQHLGQVYKHGGRRFFDVAAIHPFSLYVSNVIKILRWSRATMRRHHDARKPLVVSELSWPSAKGRTTQQYGFETTPKGQAQRVRAGFEAVAKVRKRYRITAVFWSTWLSYDRDKTYSFDYAGLRRFRNGKVQAKPAFYAFRRVARQLTR